MSPAAWKITRTLQENRAVFDEVYFLPRVLVDVAGRNLANLFWDGSIPRRSASPMGISALTAYRGDLVLAEAAERPQIPMVLSSSFLTQFEDVIEAAPPLDIGTIMHAYLLQTEQQRCFCLMLVSSSCERQAFECERTGSIKTWVAAPRGHFISVRFPCRKPSMSTFWRGTAVPFSSWASLIRHNENTARQLTRAFQRHRIGKI
jgi:hypothetical protein